MLSVIPDICAPPGGTRSCLARGRRAPEPSPRPVRRSPAQTPSIPRSHRDEHQAGPVKCFGEVARVVQARKADVQPVGFAEGAAALAVVTNERGSDTATAATPRDHAEPAVIPGQRPRPRLLAPHMLGGTRLPRWGRTSLPDRSRFGSANEHPRIVTCVGPDGRAR